MTAKEIKELLAYLRSIDISLGRIAAALEKSKDEGELDQLTKMKMNFVN